MTGDGVNDAPALQGGRTSASRWAARGTDVAREAAALVLLDDDFASIVQAVRMGRRIFDNLQEGDGLHRGGPCADRRDVARAGAVRLAAGARCRSTSCSWN